MPLTGDMSENLDKTKNFSITGVKDLDGGSVTANVFAQGVRDIPDPTKLNAPSYGVAGASLGVANTAGHSVGASAHHIPNYGNQLTASTNLNVLGTEDHRVAVNAFTKTTIPKAAPSFATHGGAVEYSYKDKLGAHASVAHTPMFKHTEHNIGGRINLHQTPTSSLDLHLGAQRTDTAFGRGNWGKNAAFGFKKTF